MPEEKRERDKTEKSFSQEGFIFPSSRNGFIIECDDDSTARRKSLSAVFSPLCIMLGIKEYKGKWKCENKTP